MTQRERPTPNGGTSVASRPPVSRSAQPPLNPPLAGSGSLWIEWFERASPEQRQQVLVRAGEQGVVVAQQLPAVAAKSPREARPFLAGMLSGPPLPPIRLPEIQVFDTALDSTQRQAVASALHSPDIALIQGLPGTGKSRVIAEIVRQAIANGQRILLVAQHGSALDRVLELLAGDSSVRPLRCLAPEEKLDSLPASIRSLSGPGVIRSVQERSLPAAKGRAKAAETELAALQGDEPRWKTFTEVLARFDELESQLLEVGQNSGRRETLEAELASETTGENQLRQHWLECAKKRDQSLVSLAERQKELQQQLDRLLSEYGQLEREKEQLHPLAEARQGKRWWTGTFWKAFFQRSKLHRLGEVQLRCTHLQEEKTRLEQDLLRNTAEREQVNSACEEERRQLVENELRTRQVARKTAIDEERQQLAQFWEETLAALSRPALRPTERSPAAVQLRREQWVNQLASAQQEAERAGQWVKALEQSLPGLPGRLLRWANLVASPSSGLTADPLLDVNSENGCFDLLIVEEAHLVPEAEFAALLRRAPRLVAVGEPSSNSEESGNPSRRGPGPGGRAPRSVVVRPGYFQQLWMRLHTDPANLPSRWSELHPAGCEPLRICRLRPVPAGQESWVESERLADRPEIELRIVAPPRKDPHIAEVIFPASMPVQEAKEFVYHELQELTVQPAGHALHWCETPERITLELSPACEGQEAVTATLDAGLREVVSLHPLCRDGIPCPTLALQFDRAEGWDRDRAERWVEERLHLRDRGRTTLLVSPYRALPSLARCLGEVLFPGSNWFRSSSSGGDWAADLGSAAVELISVPSMSANQLPEDRQGETEPHSNGASPELEPEVNPSARPQTPPSSGHRRGAGFEVDLADNRRSEHLPPELRNALPRNGLVNFPEARAVVQTLEGLLREPALQVAWSDWQKNPSAGPRPLAVAVMALFPTQVELIRLLIQESPSLSAASGFFEVGVPAQFQQRECLVALLSLTRSHTHRAVPFSDHPRNLVLALTRAVARILVFGDPGTMIRRTQWNGALDHLDDGAGRREQALIHHFLGHLVEGAPEPATALEPHLTESSSV